ncbi:MAG: PDZ domain-containing protein [Planctomycetota bacterium]|jgi:hypothetical protein
MIMIVESVVVGTLLIGAPLERCHPAVELDYQAGGGSSVTQTDQLLRWTTGEQGTLELRLTAAERGTYALSVVAAAGTTLPAITVKLWDDPLTRDGQRAVELVSGPAHDRSRARFDPVSLGPGRHVLELSSPGSGELLLDCISLERVGDWQPPPGDRVTGTAFLGVEMDREVGLGVMIRRTVPGAAAELAGLEAGDVIVTANGERITSTRELSAAVRRHRPGERLTLELLRDGEPMTLVAVLGRTTDSQRSRSRAWHVIEVLDIRRGQVIADLGCGSGWLSEAIAAEVGPEGLVYAVEIQERLIRALRRSASPPVLPVY